MSAQYVADAMHRVEAVLRRRPDMGLHEDSEALASWRGSTRIVTGNGKGIEISTDMPAEMGGTGDQVTPGWLLRANAEGHLGGRDRLLGDGGLVEPGIAHDRAEAGAVVEANGRDRPVDVGPLQPGVEGRAG